MIETATVQSVRRPEILRNELSRRFWVLLLISVAHLPLGLLIYVSGPFGLLHPIAVFLTGLYWAVNKRYRLERASLAIAYLVGAEVLWRMAHTPIFWEFGKYGSAVIAVVALVRRGHFDIPKLPLVYLSVLIPACVLTLTQTDLGSIQAILSTQMSGPFFLFVAFWLFSNVRFDQSQLRELFLAMIVPLLSVAFVTFFFTVTIEDIQFTGESNFATSGGFGPNQVSAMLGLGAFLAVTCLLVFQNAKRYRTYFLIAAIIFAAQSVMTFSRGGIYNAVGAIIVIFLLELKRPSMAVRRIAPVLVIVVVFLVLIFPALNNFTGGRLLDRFQDTDTTGRAEIVESDLNLFMENPLFGVGVGASYGLRAPFLDHKAMSHTEFSRLLSEHGLFGIVAIILLALMIISNFRRQRTIMARAIVAGSVMWSCLFMTNAAMRMAAPSFLLGLMFATFVFRVQTRKRLSPAGKVTKETPDSRYSPATLSRPQMDRMNEEQ